MAVKYAKDYDCTRCLRKGKHVKSVVFVGLNDPDGEEFPMCRPHADEWWMDVMIELQDIKDEHNLRMALHSKNSKKPKKTRSNSG